jgi:hypothetical protein
VLAGDVAGDEGRDHPSDHRRAVNDGAAEGSGSAPGASLYTQHSPMEPVFSLVSAGDARLQCLLRGPYRVVEDTSPPSGCTSWPAPERSCDDVEAAKVQADQTARPRAPRFPTPDVARSQQEGVSTREVRARPRPGTAPGGHGSAGC